MCRSCGSIVGAGEATCAVCGASTKALPSASLAGDAPPDHDAIRFARAILARPYKFTIILLVANLFVFLIMWETSGLTGDSLWQGFPEPVLRAYGAKLNYLINSPYREWWRFVTPMFVHVNLIHLLVNMYSLWIVGPYVEKLYGSAKFVVFWVLTGIAGVVASYLTVHPSLATSSLGRFIFKDADVPSAGASGALFGLVGVLFIFGIKYRHELPEGFKRAFGTGLLPVILINFVIGFLGRGFIDNSAHIGGLVSGAALASVVHYRRPGEHPGVAATWRLLQVLALGLVGLSFFKASQRLNLYLPHPSQTITVVDEKMRSFVNYVSVMNQGQETASKLIYDRDAPNANATANAVGAVEPPDAKAAELRDKLLAMLVLMSTQASAKPSPDTGPRNANKIDQKLVDEFLSWRKDYDAWLKTAVQTYTGNSPPTH